MKSSIFFKVAVAGIIFMALALDSNAQQINEQELKLNAAPITNTLAKVMKLKPVTFQYNLKDYSYLILPRGSHYGFLTADVQPLFPDMVTEISKIYPSGKNNSQTARYQEVENVKLIPVLVAAIKEQQVEIDLLKREIEQLKDKKAK